MGRKEDSEREAIAGSEADLSPWATSGPGEALLKALGSPSHLQQPPSVLCPGLALLMRVRTQLDREAQL